MAKRGENGGVRPGAGRPKGSRNKRTSEVARLIAEKPLGSGDVTPLEVMIGAMRAYWREAAPDGVVINLAAAEKASKLAEAAAPFMHPRLASVDNRVSGNLPYQSVVVPVAERNPLPPEKAALAALASGKFRPN